MNGVLKILGVAVLCLLSGILGGALTRQFGTSNYTVSYADFIAIMLTGVSLLIALLAIVLTILGVVGWRSIQNQAHDKTSEFLVEGFKEGNPLYTMLRARVDEAMFEGIDPIDTDNEDDDSKEDVQ